MPAAKSPGQLPGPAADLEAQPIAALKRQYGGPTANLEAHLPAEWWQKLFNALYRKNDDDVVENSADIRREVDFIVAAAAIQPHSQILDLCCGQGHHCLELARRGFKYVMGVDRSHQLIRLASELAQTEGLQVTFKEGDARNLGLPEASLDCVAILGSSLGYFSNKQDDEKVLRNIGKVLRPTGQLALAINNGAYMAEHFERRSWEWIDEHNFVCRERSLSADRERLISREVIVHDEMGVTADQFYAERLYTKGGIGKLLEKCGFRNIRHYDDAVAVWDRDQEIRTMPRRLLLVADAPSIATRALLAPIGSSIMDNRSESFQSKPELGSSKTLSLGQPSLEEIRSIRQVSTKALKVISETPDDPIAFAAVDAAICDHRMVASLATLDLGTVFSGSVVDTEAREVLLILKSMACKT